MPRRVEHLVDVILRKIKRPKAGEEDAPMGVLTRRDFRNWAISALGSTADEIPETWRKDKQIGEQQLQEE